MKSYTDLLQSKKLTEFLPIESADMHYFVADSLEKQEINYAIRCGIPIVKTDIPCWSLAALHCVASTYCSRLEITLRADKKYNVFAVKDDFVFRSFDDHPDGFDNLVDACYEMVLKLNEKNLL